MKESRLLLQALRREIIFVVALVALLLYCYFDPSNLVDRFLTPLSEFFKQIIYAILTSFITATLVLAYGKTKKFSTNRKYIGYWGVGKYIIEMEGYDYGHEMVQIAFTKDLDILSYFYQDSRNLNTMKGSIYINPENPRMADLVTISENLNLITTLYPAHSQKIYLDRSDWTGEGSEWILRVLNADGTEREIYQRPIDESVFLKTIQDNISETQFNMGSPLPESISGITTKE